jgi:hypothetical protein
VAACAGRCQRQMVAYTSTCPGTASRLLPPLLSTDCDPTTGEPLCLSRCLAFGLGSIVIAGDQVRDQCFNGWPLVKLPVVGPTFEPGQHLLAPHLRRRFRQNGLVG